MANNNAVVYEGLFEFRNVVLPFIVEKLKAVYGEGWWKAGVERALGPTTTEHMRSQYERRYKQSLASVIRPDSEVEQMLDIAHFLPIIQSN